MNGNYKGNCKVKHYRGKDKDNIKKNVKKTMKRKHNIIYKRENIKET